MIIMNTFPHAQEKSVCAKSIFQQAGRVLIALCCFRNSMWMEK